MTYPSPVRCEHAVLAAFESIEKDLDAMPIDDLVSKCRCGCSELKPAIVLSIVTDDGVGLGLVLIGLERELNKFIERWCYGTNRLHGLVQCKTCLESERAGMGPTE